ncbi:CHAT domain-containing protein [Caenimonas sedimenti]|uniref:CHAT domain-containing protein n=1 Tax=Caenimonas sedimenti TaxID=2596921 RepID=A0A562ZVS3_9BURK|nr:CHAT domain-containing protein [Caenimonas sedimenti]TWO72418.1 CHAT domain-containing protein [Caenimonas sedimenti]
MATKNSQVFTFVVHGEVPARAPQRPKRLPPKARQKESILVGTPRRGDAKPHRVTAREGEDVVVLTLANGPRLVLHPANAAELFRAQADSVQRSPSRGKSDGTDIPVPAQLAWPGRSGATARGTARNILSAGATLLQLDIVELFKDPAVDLAAAAVTLALDGKVAEGVYALSPTKRPEALKRKAKPIQVPPAEDGGPMLVMLHGTFVDTDSTFGKLWTLHPERVRALFTSYKDRVYALDHPTMGRSPIGNALTLAKALPAGARLHLVTHSRGGLVGEALARACGGGALRPEELALFARPGYETHAKELKELVKVAQAKGLQVERMVRVACPSRGTLLASRRLDAYLSVLEWSLELAGVPLLPEIVDFLHEVARRRARPEELPGLEALMPESPVVAWLNSRPDPIPGELRVVAGDVEGESLLSWLKTLVADAYYWTDNDLVVQTRSMYGGMPRKANSRGAAARFVLDRGANATHFGYFSNSSTATAITDALLRDDPPGFQDIGILSWAGEEASGTRAAAATKRSRGTAQERAARPAVLVLPGIVGSNIALKGDRVWLGAGFVNGLKKMAWDPKTDQDFSATTPIGFIYDDLIDRLADTHEVLPFAYDWRRPMEDEARRLAAAVEGALAIRGASGQPVRIIAHSMGGLVARTMQLEAPDTWKRMMARDGARLVMLGTPNGGSWAPMQILSGDDDFGNTLAALGSLFDNRGARQVMAGMPGFLQLQAGLLDPALGLGQESTWRELARKDIESLLERNHWHEPNAQKAVYQWGAPPQKVLDRAVALRTRLDAQLGSLAADASKICLVVGTAEFTPAGYVLDNEGLEYLAAVRGGDGRVPLESALLPGVKTWQVDAAHGKLPDVRSAFQGYVDLLVQGKTTNLAATEAGLRDAGSRAAPASSPKVRTRPARAFQAWQEPASPYDEVGEGTAGSGQHRPGAALQVRVLNGDLQFIREPLLVGHYRASRLSGAERVVDRMVGKAMRRALDTGLYPDAPGSHQIFGNRRPNPENPLELARPASVVVVGIGEEGKLDAGRLAQAVRQGVLAYAQRLSEVEETAPHFDLAATLIGSGGTGVTVGSAAQAIVNGALDAMARIAEQNAEGEAGGWPQLGQLTLVELYLDRATEAWRALGQLEEAEPGRLRVAPEVAIERGALRRMLDAGYRGADYDFISVLGAKGPGETQCLNYRLDTTRARAEVTGQHAQAALLRQLVNVASNDANTDPQIGRTLFQLLVPVEIEAYLAGSGEMVIELDDQTAAIPWEMLDTTDARRPDQKSPWAIRSKLIRKLRTDVFRGAVNDAGADDSVLIIGEPECDPERYPPLDGARREAAAVRDRMATVLPPSSIRDLVDRNDAKSIISALFERPYRIIHVAGHGEPGPQGGVVLSGAHTFLGANEIRALRVVPELVFLNCCHLAARDFRGTPRRFDRSAFAANISDELIRAGVRCVVAAGWAVEDDAAEQFAGAFYSALLAGARFMDAVARAREAAYACNPAGNTWAAYQCYGDPEWTWRAGTGDAQRPTPPLADVLAAVATPPALCLALENLASDVEFGRTSVQTASDRLQYLEKQFGTRWGGMGMVSDAFGVAYGRAGDAESAVRWYTTAVQAADGTASFRAAEQLANHIVRAAEKRGDVAAALDGIARLEALVAIHRTRERESLLGSAYKRLTMIQTKARRRRDALRALGRAATHYHAAEKLAVAQGAADLFYPAKNALSCELRAALFAGKPLTLDAARVQLVRGAMERSASEAPEFWTVVGLTELLILEALVEGRLAPQLQGFLASLRDLKDRVPAPNLWDSVLNEGEFTLVPYIGKTRNAAEKRAATDLLGALRELAEARSEPEAPAASSRRSPARPAGQRNPRGARPRPAAPPKR